MKRLALLIPLLLLTGCQTNVRGNAEKQSLNLAQVQLPRALTRSESAQKDVWRFISNEHRLKVPDNERISKEKNNYLARPKSIIDIAARSEPFIYWIIEQLIQRDMPIELALLPMLESAFDPLATSSAKAAGLWQIIPNTAKAYGIDKDQWFDPRRDIVRSTTVALDMLQRLNKRFDGDWLLTLAAYNAGEGRVSRAMRWNQSMGLPTHYWALNLPAETMSYVPKMLALIDIITHRSAYNIALPTSDYSNGLTLVDVGQQIKLKNAADMIGISLEEMVLYNAGYTRKITQPTGPHYLMVPNAYVDALHQSLIQNNFTAAEIVDYNSSSKTTANFDIALTNEKYRYVTNSDLAYFAQQHVKYSQIRYVVKPGDSLYAIAKQHNVNIKDILRWNKVANAHLLKPGDLLTIQIKNGGGRS